LLLNMALSLWWVRLMGMPGPAWATAVATMVELIVFIWLIRRTLGLPLAQLLPPGELMRSARLALMAGLAAVGGILIGHSPLEELICAGILHAVVYLGLQLPGGELKRRLGELVK
jgi:Na+-driven multidrug efflux pump